MTRLNLIFDLDGTLTDSREGVIRSIRYALDRVGVSAVSGEELDNCIGPPLLDSFTRLLGPGRSHLTPQALEHYQQRYADVGIFESRPYDGIRDCLRDLEGLANLYVATSNRTDYSKQILAHFGLDGYFGRIQGSANWQDGDKSDRIAELLKAEGFDPSTAFMIGDRYHDIEGARKNWIASVGILWGYGTEAELAASGAAAIISHPQELSGYFKSYRLGNKPLGLGGVKTWE
jgi:phosphoglycolate phosphatase